MKSFSFYGGPLDGQCISVSSARFDGYLKGYRRSPRTGPIPQPTFRHKEGGAIYFYRCPPENISAEELSFEYAARLTPDEGLLFADEIQETASV